MDITSIKKMTLVERLQAMELLWDSLSQDENELESPDWHHKVLAQMGQTLLGLDRKASPCYVQLVQEGLGKYSSLFQ